MPKKFQVSTDGLTLTIVDVCKDCQDGSGSVDFSTDLQVIQCNASNEHGYAFGNSYVNVLSELNSVTSSKNG